MRWAICGQPTSIPIEHQIHDIIGLGIGHLAKVPPEDFNAEGNHQVYIVDRQAIDYPISQVPFREMALDIEEGVDLQFAFFRS